MRFICLLLSAAVLGLLGGYFAEPALRAHLWAGAAAPDVEALAAEEAALPEDDAQPVADTPEPTPAEEEDFSDIFAIDGVKDGEWLVEGTKSADSYEDAQDEEPEEEEASDDETRPRRMTRIANEETSRPVREENYTGNLPAAAWKYPKALKKRLAGRLRSRFRGTEPEQVKEFLRDPETRLMLAQWELLHRADIDELTKLMRRRGVCESLSPLLNDLPWVASFVYDSDLEKPELVLDMIQHFRQLDANMDSEVYADVAGARPGLKRRVAAAVAVEFVRHGWYGGEAEPLTAEQQAELRQMGMPVAELRRDKNDPYRLARERYLFFAESLERELLNVNIAKLPDWQLRFVCGWKGDSPFGTASTMRWLRDNVSAPVSRYTGMHSQVPYRASNVYGDSIHGAYYYQPFDVLYPGNFAKETRDVGAVCGGLSHFGASSACANGVPAITVGEPGHCAFAVYQGGKWVPCNSIYDEHSPHRKVWSAGSTWSSLLMMSAMYEDGARTRDAQMLSSLAAMLAGNRNPNNALRAYEMSAMMQPLNLPIWDAYIATAQNALKRRPRRWLGVAEFICAEVAPRHPEMCADFLRNKVYPSMLPTMRSDKQKLEAFRYFFRHIRYNEVGDWDFEGLLDCQIDAFARSRPRRLELLQTVAESVVQKPDFGVALTWAVKRAFAESKRSGEQILEMVDAAAASCPDKLLLDAALIRAGEEMGDAELVHKYSRDYMQGKGERLPAFERPEGNLVSDKGMVQLESYYPDQSSIPMHCAALSECGGLIRSYNAKHQKLTVVLPKPVRLGAVVIIPENAARYKQWNLEVSTDGKHWKTVAELPEAHPKPVVRVMFRSNAPSARYIRVDSGADDTAGINFKAFLIYDNKKAKAH